MPKLLHINSYYSTSGLFSELYDRQVESSLDIDVYVPISHEYPQEKLAAKGDYTLVSRNHHYLDRLFYHYKYNKILKDLKRHYHVDSYDLIHANSLFSNGFLAYKLWKSHQIPYIVSVRSADVRTFFQKLIWLRPTGINILKNAQAIVFISTNAYNEVLRKYVPKEFRREFMAKSMVIANGVTPFWLENINHNKTTDLQQPLQIVTVGKTLYEKRFVETGQMIQKINQHTPCHLHVVGPNWDNKIVSALEKNPYVTYHGPKNKEELKDFLRRMDIFTLLSSRETFGLVYVEAMTQGLPVIYTKNEGFDGYFEDGWVGVSVDISDENALEKAIQQVVSNYSDMVKHALKESQSFNWDDVNQSYITLYNKILNKEENLWQK